MSAEPFRTIQKQQDRRANRTMPMGCSIPLRADGLSEAEDHEGSAFGIDPCRDLLIQRSQAPLPTILDGVRDALTSFCGSGALEDDCTLLLLRLP